MTSKHYAISRKERERKIQEIGVGEVIFTFVRARRNHVPARFEITTTALVKVWAVDKENFLITQYYARPQQLREIFQDTKIPDFLIELSIKYKKQSINEI